MRYRKRFSIKIPFLPELSKNKRYAFKSSKVKNPSHRKAQDLITIMLKKKISGKTLNPPGNKLIVDVTIFKPNNRFDASNFVNPINDAVERATGINDRYYAGSYDWFIDRNNPSIIIVVGY